MSFRGIFDVEGPLAGPSTSLRGVFAFRVTAVAAKLIYKSFKSILFVYILALYLQYIVKTIWDYDDDFNQSR